MSAEKELHPKYQEGAPGEFSPLDEEVKKARKEGGEKAVEALKEKMEKATGRKRLGESKKAEKSFERAAEREGL